MTRACAAGAAALAVALAGGSARAEPTLPHELDNGLVRADECEYCHSYNNDPDAAADPIYAPYFTWRGSMMANAARDPVFWAGVAIAAQDAPDPAETAECIRCHAPRAFLEGRGDAIAQDELLFEDLAGVECELCHRMVADAPPGNGAYTIDDVLVGENVPRRGPWAYDDGVIPAPPHEVLADEFVGSAQMCGTCHDVTTARDRVDADGAPLGTKFNEQRTYGEWAGSAFATAGEGFRSCQDCHMPAVADMPGCRDNVTMFAHAEGGRRHDLLGANRFVIALLAEDASVLDTVAFNHSLNQLDEFVRSAATLDVEGPASVDLGDGLDDLVVVVTNESGHKLPTGYSEGRVMWLEVVASHDDAVVWSSGVWDPRAQSFARDPQLRTYEAIAQQHATGARFHVLLDDEWLSDTRIPPRGLVADLETDPVTDRYVLQDDGTWPHFDTHTYAFAGVPALADADGELRVVVRLLYLVNTPEYVEFLASENVTNSAGTDVAARFDEAGGAPPLVLVERELVIPILDAMPPADSSSGGDGTTTTTGSGSSDSTTAEPGTSTSSSGGADTTGPANNGGGEGCGCNAVAGSPWWLAVLPAIRRRRR